MDDIIQFWFPNDKFQKFWFDKSKDEIIINKFNTILDEEGKKEFDISKKSNIEILEYIILFDQISRHVFRNNREDGKFKSYNEKALIFSLYFLNNRFNYDIEFNYLSFILMPLRHSNEIKYYDLIINILNEIKINNIYFKKFVKDEKLFNKFNLATERNYKLITS
jgi:uncharacterized protein (DUF924 family)